MIKLDGPVSEPKSGVTKKLVILLHGLGADGNDLFGLVPYFQEVLSDTKFVSPHAPFDCDMAPIGKQWFSLANRTEDAIIDGVKEAEPILNNFIDEQKKELNLEDKDIALIGFSQGSMLSIYTALRREKKLGAVLAYSGALIGEQKLQSEIKSRLPICLIHGQEDQVVPFDAFNNALTALQKNSVPVQGFSRDNLAHGIDPDGVKIGITFLSQELFFNKN